ncbi:hypothetical protein BDR07DRAFT_1370813 [Suillus spraguei]|nr:hypothetical protein BDR07DRAFT_1370813 [Suillus spraguei]
MSQVLNNYKALMEQCIACLLVKPSKTNSAILDVPNRPCDTMYGYDISQKWLYGTARSFLAKLHPDHSETNARLNPSCSFKKNFHTQSLSMAYAILPPGQIVPAECSRWNHGEAGLGVKFDVFKYVIMPALGRLGHSIVNEANHSYTAIPQKFVVASLRTGSPKAKASDSRRHTSPLFFDDKIN